MYCCCICRWCCCYYCSSCRPTFDPSWSLRRKQTTETKGALVDADGLSQVISMPWKSSPRSRKGKRYAVCSPVVLDLVVRSSRKELRDFRPTVPQPTPRVRHDLLLLGTPRVLLDNRVCKTNNKQFQKAALPCCSAPNGGPGRWTGHGGERSDTRDVCTCPYAHLPSEASYCM